MGESTRAAEVPEEGLHGDFLVPARRINCARVDIFGFECGNKMAQFGVGGVAGVGEVL